MPSTSTAVGVSAEWSNTYSGSGGTTIVAGTLKLGVNNALPATAVSIGSATLDAATFTDTTIGSLNVTGTATINLGSGAALAFASSSGVDWTGGTLNVTGTLGATSLRFGTTNGGLLPAQLALISVNGSGLGTYSLDDSGYLIAPAGGDTYSDWATSNSITGGETGDSDNDGVKNLIEYALVDGGERGVLTGNTITFTKRGEPYGSDLTYVIETSESLGTGSWTDEVTHGPELLLSNPAISYTFTPGTPVKKFARLKIVTTP